MILTDSVGEGQGNHEQDHRKHERGGDREALPEHAPHLEIEDRRSPGFVIRRATDRSLTFANLKHRKGVEYGPHLRTSDCAFQ